MQREFDFKGTLDRLLSIENEDDLHCQLERCAVELGFTCFAMGHHVDLLNPRDDAVRLTNYHPDWIERSLGEGYYVDDPVHRASTKTAAGFLWSSIPELIRMTPRQTLILEAAETYGLREGYTVPVNVPGEYRGTCSFGTDTLDAMPMNALPVANMIGIWAFEAARRLMRSRSAVPTRFSDIPQLTTRQRDSLVLVARGKGDAEIGMAMGISISTAHEHVENVRRAYGNAQRPYLIARALFDGQISWGEVLGS